MKATSRMAVTMTRATFEQGLQGCVDSVADTIINLEKPLEIAVEATFAAATAEFILFSINENDTFTLHSGHYRCTALQNILETTLKIEKKIKNHVN